MRRPLKSPITPAMSGTSRATCSAIGRASVLMSLISSWTASGSPRREARSDPPSWGDRDAEVGHGVGAGSKRGHWLPGGTGGVAPGFTTVGPPAAMESTNDRPMAG
jgi:hypothetical protein